MVFVQSKGTQSLGSASQMSKEDARRLQAIIDGGPSGANLDLNPTTGKLTWGCANCGTAPLPFSKGCSNGAMFPGCKENR